VRQRRRSPAAGRADEAQVLVAEAGVGLQAQAPAQLRVVAQLGVGVQRQVVGEQVDVVPPAGAPRAGFSQPVSRPSWPRQNRPWCTSSGIGAARPCAASMKARLAVTPDTMWRTSAALDLQTVRPIILEPIRPAASAGWIRCLARSAMVPTLRDVA
jgi:hypothetical protein